MTYPQDLALVAATDPVLRRRAETVNAFDDDLRAFVARMHAFVAERKFAIGLAAPQVGVPLRIFVALGRAFINPRVTPCGGFIQRISEGCLSLPGVERRVIRAVYIEVASDDERGDHHVERFSHSDAIVVQHEHDHLEGRLITDASRP